MARRASALLVGLGLLLGAPSGRALDFCSQPGSEVCAANLTEWGFIDPLGDAELSFDGGATDELFEHFGYLANSNGVLRVDDNNFTASGGFSSSGNSASSSLALNGSGASTLGLASGSVGIQHDFTLVDDTGSGDRDAFLFTVTIVNRGSSPLDLTYYSYLDLDVAGDFADDSADVQPDRMRIWDNTGAMVEFDVTSGAVNGFAIREYSVIRDFFDNTATSAINLPNNIVPSPFTDLDFTTIVEFDISLDAAQQAIIPLRLRRGPEPGTGLLLGMGLLTLGWRRRRLRRASA